MHVIPIKSRVCSAYIHPEKLAAHVLEEVIDKVGLVPVKILYP